MARSRDRDAQKPPRLKVWCLLTIGEELGSLVALHDDHAVEFFAFGLVHVHEDESLRIALLCRELLLIEGAANMIRRPSVASKLIPLIRQPPADLVGRAEEANKARRLHDLFEAIGTVENPPCSKPISAWISDELDAGGRLSHDVLGPCGPGVLAVAEQLRVRAVAITNGERTRDRTVARGGALDFEVVSNGFESAGRAFQRSFRWPFQNCGDDLAGKI